jgi:hypothetical protein
VVEVKAVTLEDRLLLFPRDFPQLSHFPAGSFRVTLRIMKKLLWPCSVVLLCVSLLLGGVAQAAGTSRPSTSTKSTPGLEMAQAISTITGVAISPLLGVSAIGAWTYFKAPAEKRARLSWYAQPWFWVPALLLVAVAFVKDTFGTALPTAVKKPFDIAETIENKISGLVAAGAFVPLIAAVFSSAGVDDSTLYGDAGLAAINIAPLLNILTIPFAVAAFVVVWMVSHVINVLIIISPFTTVDAALKSVRLFFLSTVAGTAFVDPYVGAVWSLVLIVICWFLAGWSFRLMIFGSVFTWDFVTFHKTRFKLAPDANWVFTAQEAGKTPIRSYGKLARDANGELVLSYRPWLFLPRRTLALPAGKYAVGRGLFYSEIVRVEDADTTTSIITLPPRYRSHEEELSSIYSLGGVQDIGMLKGFKAIWSWLQPSPAATAWVVTEQDAKEQAWSS